MLQEVIQSLLTEEMISDQMLPINFESVSKLRDRLERGHNPWNVTGHNQVCKPMLCIYYRAI